MGIVCRLRRSQIGEAVEFSKNKGLFRLAELLERFAHPLRSNATVLQGICRDGACGYVLSREDFEDGTHALNLMLELLSLSKSTHPSVVSKASQYEETELTQVLGSICSTYAVPLIIESVGTMSAEELYLLSLSTRYVARVISKFEKVPSLSIAFKGRTIELAYESSEKSPWLGEGEIFIEKLIEKDKSARSVLLLFIEQASEEGWCRFKATGRNDGVTFELTFL